MVEFIQKVGILSNASNAIINDIEGVFFANGILVMKNLWVNLTNLKLNKKKDI